MSPRPRPLSPHLSIYRLPLLAILSISHRITGVGLALGTILLAYWLGSVAYGPEAYATARAVIGSPIGYFLLFCWSVALFFHLCNGVRHLAWDAGWGFELPRAHLTNRLVLIATAALTVLAWAIGLSV